MIMFIAGACDPPLSASFARNLMRAPTQGLLAHPNPNYLVDRLSGWPKFRNCIYQTTAAVQI